MKKVNDVAQLDREWISLIKEAKTTGLRLEEVREFLLKDRKNT